MKSIGNEQQIQLIDSFVVDLEKTFGVEHKKLSFEQVWHDDPPSEAKGETLMEYMKEVSRDSFFYEDYHNFDAFRKEYRDKFGRDAYTSPPVRWQWYVQYHALF
jgi:hypothetical protein